MTWKTVKYLWQWQLKNSPAALWPYVADTHRFNQASNLPPMDYTEIPLESGGSRRLARTNKWGISVEFEDFPFNWVREQEFSVLRLFQYGPLARTYTRVSLEPNDEGCLLNYYVEVTPANLLGRTGIPYQFGWEMRRNFERVFRQIDEALQNQMPQPFPLKVTPLSATAQARLAGLSQQLSAQGHESCWVQHLAELLANEPELNLVRMRPYVLADAWQAPRRVILEMFLSAAKIGLLKMSWNILCPLCRGAKFTASSLDAVQKGVHCSTCNIDFEGDFSKNVELTFTVHPQIRTAYDDSYCIGGPMVTPHILVQQTLEPGETRCLRVKLEPGSYRLRTQKPGVEQWLDLQPEAQPGPVKLCIRLETNALQATTQIAQPDPKDAPAAQDCWLEITNKTPDAQRFCLEKADWYTGAVTAAQVTTLR
jgi:hypothetical protein